MHTYAKGRFPFPFRKKLFLSFMITLLIFTINGYTQSKGSGRIAGKIVDSETGDPVIGANVFIEELVGYGSSTDLDGRYMILKVPEGKYTLVASYVGYADTKINEVKIESRETTKIDIVMDSEVLSTETLVVQADLIKNTEASLLSMRQKSVNVQDLISAEKIAMIGAGDMAEAMRAVTGVGVYDGKFALIRGVGDRYTNATLNGSQIPSADPNKRDIHLDMLPSALFENVAAIKTFTPDKPGNFTGGMMEFQTKSIPEERTIGFSVSTSYNSVSSLNSEFLTARESGNTDWLGMDDGKRDVPAYIDGKTKEELDGVYTNFLADSVSNAFQNPMVPRSIESPLNQSYSFQYGDRYQLFGKPLGLIVGLSYKNKYSYLKSSQIYWRFIRGASIESKEQLLPEIGADSYIQSANEINWGINGNISYHFSPIHQVNLNYFQSQFGNKSAGFVSRFNDLNERPYDGSSRVQDHWIRFNERRLQSFQLSGEHFFDFIADIKMDWTASSANTREDDPDYRVMTYILEVSHFGDTLAYFDEQQVGAPSHYYRKVNDDIYDFGLNLSSDFKQWSGFKSKVKFGLHFSEKERDYSQLRYWYSWDARSQRTTDYLAPDPNQWFLTGRGFNKDSTDVGSVMRKGGEGSPFFNGDYTASERIPAAYLMFELPIFQNVKLIGGVRFEETRILVKSALNNNQIQGKINKEHWLPSVNFVYNFLGNMNFRASYTQTLARPSFRELAPVQYKDNLAGLVIRGNENLKITDSKNYDLRYEWFPRPGELLSLSWYYKDLKNPISYGVGNLGGSQRAIGFQNQESGRIWGLEFESRKQLDFFRITRAFQFGFNYTYIYSFMGKKRPDAGNKIAGLYDNSRPITGQSPYLVNLDLSYINQKGTNISLYFNSYGDRLFLNSLGDEPDVYEKGRSTLNLNLRQKIWNGISLKLAAENILDTEVRYTQEFKTVDGETFETVYDEYRTGVLYSVGFSYSLE
jgi:TonB-dependent receptor